MVTWVFLLTLAGAPDRVLLMPVNGAGLTRGEVARIKATVTKKLERASGACIVPVEKIEMAKERGMPLDSLQVCGVPMSEALASPHRLSVNIAKGNGHYYGIFKLELGPPQAVKRRENLEAKTLKGMLKVVSAAIARNFRGAAPGGR